MSEAFGSDKPLLDARLQGAKYEAAANSVSDHYFEFTRDCFFNGIELLAIDPNFDDEIELLTEYYAGPYGWQRYKKFGKTFNVVPNSLQKYVLLPAEPSAGVRVRIKYNNTGNDPVKFWVNYYVFTDLESVKPSLLENGEDW